ncbi:MAG: hypothetical protein ACXWJC_11710 [Croceibacterium sp.]
MTGTKTGSRRVQIFLNAYLSGAKGRLAPPVAIDNSNKIVAAAVEPDAVLCVP